jgi:hypothetical protein
VGLARARHVWHSFAPLDDKNRAGYAASRCRPDGQSPGDPYRIAHYGSRWRQLPARGDPVVAGGTPELCPALQPAADHVFELGRTPGRQTDDAAPARAYDQSRRFQCSSGASGPYELLPRQGRAEQISPVGAVTGQRFASDQPDARRRVLNEQADRRRLEAWIWHVTNTCCR